MIYDHDDDDKIAPALYLHPMPQHKIAGTVTSGLKCHLYLLYRTADTLEPRKIPTATGSLTEVI
jgi:hypothetical protein